MNRKIGIACLLAVLLLVALQPVLAPHDPMTVEPAHSMRSPHWEHPLGTDSIGRDVMARLAAGTWYSLTVALVALFVSSVIGAALGAVAGFSGGVTDRTLSALTDLLLAFPRFLILLNLAAILTFESATGLGLLIGCVSWMGTARLVRTEVLSLRERPFVEAARAAGADRPRVIVMHVVPHVARLVLERAGLRFAAVILLAATLDYVGLGLPADRPTWGRLIRDGQEYLQTAPWITLSGVATLCLTAVGGVLAAERRRSSQVRH